MILYARSMTESYKEKMRISARVWTLCSIVATVGANGLLLSPMLSEVALSLRTTPETIALAMTTYGAGTALSALCLGPLIDRFGEQSALKWGLGLLCVALVTSASASHITLLCLAQFIAGLGAGILLPASYGMATSIAAPADQARVLGRVLTGWSLALIGGVPLSAFIAEHSSWRLSYAILGVASFVAMLLVRRFPQPVRTGLSGSGRTGVASAIKLPNVVSILTVALMFTASFYGTYAFVAREVQRVQDISTGWAGFVVFAFGTGFALGAFATRLADGESLGKIFPAVLLLNGAVYVLLVPAMTNFSLVLLLATVWGFANHLCLNTLVILLTKVKPEARGALLGLNSATTYLGLTIGTTLAARIYETAGFNMILFVATMLHALAILIFIGKFGASRKTV